jgi:glutamate-ammonia-ligase adenylyltransferase
MHRNEKAQWVETGFAVIAMGKLGGAELNYSSDVDLIYVYASDEGRTRPGGHGGKAKSVPNEEYFEYLARGLTGALTEQTQEGTVFRVDLRLRAEGTVGQLARSLAGYEQYYRTRGQGWERQALLKAWPIAGDPSLGREFLRMVKPFVLGMADRHVPGSNGSAVIQQIKAIKAMIDEKMEDRGHAHRNVKLGVGGIREIEFLVQALQMLCGRRLPGALNRNTMAALLRLGRAGVLSPADQKALAEAYLFLRDVEHKLQMVHDLQTHALPESPEELTRCAIRLGYSWRDRRRAMARFMADHRRHTTRVNRIFRALVHSPDQSPRLKVVLKKGVKG